jgi:hypothetical protein
MLKSATEQMTFSQVHTTTDYFLFKSIDGNRNINKLHLSRLKDSMQKNYLFTIILVNENYEIIDGQHRFTVIEELGLPLNYIIVKGYGLNEVHILNATSKKWDAQDYMEGYCNMGLKDYLIYRDFKNKYGFGHNETMALLTNNNNNISGCKISSFYNGEFEIINLPEAERKADLITAIKPYFEGYKRKSFILAMLKLLAHPNFEFTELIVKLKIQPTALQNCSDINSYIALIEEIYNYKRREKVNLRF